MKPSFFLQKNLIIWILIILLALGCAIFIYFIWHSISLSLKASPPLAFLSAYQKVSKTSKEIVDFVNETQRLIQEVNLADKSKNYDRALSLINEARQKNDETRDLAFELSQNLKEMTQSLNQLKSPKSQQLGYEAVALELALVSEFINYSQSMNKFLDTLGLTMAIDNFSNRQRVNESLRNVNQKILLINSLNRDYLNKVVLLNQSLLE